jgi:hypothetical protein
MMTLGEKIPEVEEYMCLRAVTGMPPASKIVAECGLPKSLFAVVECNANHVLIQLF